LKGGAGGPAIISLVVLMLAASGCVAPATPSRWLRLPAWWSGALPGPAGAGEAAVAAAPAEHDQVAASAVAAEVPVAATEETPEAGADAETSQDPPADVPTREPWHLGDGPREPFMPEVERWRPLVRDLLAEAWDEGRLDGAATALDDDLMLALIEQESEGDPEAESYAGAVGLAQLMPEAFARFMLGDPGLAPQLDPTWLRDPASNLRASIRYMAQALRTYDGDLYWSLAAYNAGFDAVDEWRARGFTAVPPWGGYVETASYAPAILRRYAAHRPGIEVTIPEPWRPPPPIVQPTRPPAPVQPYRPPPARPAAQRR